MPPTEKVSQVPADNSPTTTDYLLGNKASGPSTQTFLISLLINLFWTLANIPSGGTSPITRDNESQFAYVVGNTGVWSGDAYASTRNASMTALTCYINGRRIPINAVTARTYTASKDTYIDVLDNQDGTGTLVYTEVANNAASPALAANSIRIGIIVTGTTNIAAAGSINQGQENKILPIASSIAYSVTDSLGNLICSRDSANKLLGYRQITANVAISSSSATQITGLTCPVIVPLGRKATVSSYFGNIGASAGAVTYTFGVWDGTVGSGTNIENDSIGVPAGFAGSKGFVSVPVTPTTASKTYNASLAVPSGTGTVQASATQPAWVKVEI